MREAEVDVGGIVKRNKRGETDCMDQTNHVMKGLGVDEMDMALCRLFVLFCKWFFVLFGLR